MKRIVCLILVLIALSASVAALGEGLGDKLGSLGSGIAEAAKSFGLRIADASKSMFEAVKETFEENGPEIAKDVSQGVTQWVDETAPKVANFFSGLWQDIKRVVN